MKKEEENENGKRELADPDTDGQTPLMEQEAHQKSPALNGND